MLATSISSVFGFGSQSTPTKEVSAPVSNSLPKQELPFTLPVSWYTNDKIVPLAKARLYDQGWHFLTLIGSFNKDPIKNDGLQGALQFDFIANPFFGLCLVDDPYKAKDIELYYGVYEDVIEGYTTEAEKLAKLRSLKPVRHYVTEGGLLFVTHDPNEVEMWDYFGGDQLQGFLKGVDCRNVVLKKRLIYECDYNFITFLDGYQECLHCKYTHPGLAAVYPFEFYKVDNYTNFSRHHCNPADGFSENGLFLYFFPGCALNKYAGGLGLFRTIPVSGNKTRMEFEYFFDGNDEDFKEYFKFARQVAIEDIELCENAQKNLDMGLYPRGILNPEAENGVVFYQKLIKERVTGKEC